MSANAYSNADLPVPFAPSTPAAGSTRTGVLMPAVGTSLRTSALASRVASNEKWNSSRKHRMLLPVNDSRAF